MKTNEIKKGARFQLRNGWFATMYDNRKGNIRTAEVEGLYTEIGSVYSHDIVRVQVGSEWVKIEHTKAQNKCRVANSIFG